MFGMEPLDVLENEPVCDLEAECCLLGAAVVAPRETARLCLRQMRGEAFYDEYHGWMWERLGYAVKQCDWTPKGIAEWATGDKWTRTARRRFNARLLRDIDDWTSS